MNRIDRVKVALIATILFWGMVVIVALPIHLLIYSYTTSILVCFIISTIVSFLIFPINRFASIIRALDPNKVPV